MNDERARLGKVTAVIARWELRGHVRHFIYEIRKNKYKIRVSLLRNIRAIAA